MYDKRIVIIRYLFIALLLIPPCALAATTTGGAGAAWKGDSGSTVVVPTIVHVTNAMPATTTPKVRIKRASTTPPLIVTKNIPPRGVIRAFFTTLFRRLFGGEKH